MRFGALLLALAVTVPIAAQARKPPARPHPTQPAPPPKPVEPEEENIDDQPDVADLPDPPEAPLPVEPAAPQEPFTESQYEAIGFAGICCCLVGVGGLAGLIYLLVRKKKPDAPVIAPLVAAAAPPVPFHLSVMAIALTTDAAHRLEQQMLAEGIVLAPVTPAERAALVRTLSGRLRTVAMEWTHFGYGEHLDLADITAAERSYRLASEDFRFRGLNPPNSPLLPGYRVVALVLCSTRQLAGVSRLDERAQVKTMLDDREKLADTELLGADLVWSVPLAEPEMLSRYPEMHPLSN